MFNKNARLSKKDGKKTDLTKEASELLLATTRVEITNVNFLLGHQNSQTRKFWAQMEKGAGTGLLPRFIFGFGNRALVLVAGSAYTGFIGHVFEPFLRALLLQ